MLSRQASRLSTKNASVSGRLEAVNFGRDDSPQPSQSTKWMPAWVGVGALVGVKVRVRVGVGVRVGVRGRVRA